MLSVRLNGPGLVECDRTISADPLCLPFSVRLDGLDGIVCRDTVKMYDLADVMRRTAGDHASLSGRALHDLVIPEVDQDVAVLGLCTGSGA